MNASALRVPRQQSPASMSERNEEDDFDALVESIETLLFTSSDHPETLDAVVLAEAMHELERRWPEAAGRAAPARRGVWTAARLRSLPPHLPRP